MDLLRHHTRQILLHLFLNLILNWILNKLILYIYVRFNLLLIPIDVLTVPILTMITTTIQLMLTRIILEDIIKNIWKKIKKTD